MSMCNLVPNWSLQAGETRAAPRAWPHLGLFQAWPARVPLSLFPRIISILQALGVWGFQVHREYLGRASQGKDSAGSPIPKNEHIEVGLCGLPSLLAVS